MCGDRARAIYAVAKSCRPKQSAGTSPARHASGPPVLSRAYAANRKAAIESIIDADPRNCLDARLVHNAYRFALEGPSMRKPEVDTDVAATTTEPTENIAQAKLARGAKK